MNELRNLHPDPHCYRQRTTWMGLPATQTGDKWRYEKRPDYNSSLWAWWHPNDGDLILGKVLYARVYSATQAVLDNLVVEDATTLACQDGWIAAQVAENAGKSHSLPLRYGPLVLDEVAVYTSEDWDKVYGLYQRGELTRPWFAGDLLPAEAGGVPLPERYPHAAISLVVAA